MLELEGSDIDPDASQHELSSVMHQLHWIKLSLMVVYLEVISKLIMVI